MPLSIKKLLLRATNKISAQDAGNPNLQPPQEQSAFKHRHNRASRNRASACCEAHTKPTGAAHAWSDCPQCSGPPGACSLLTSSHGAAPRGSCPTPALMGLGGSSSVLLLSRARTAELCSSLRTYGANGGFPPPRINSSGGVNSCRRAPSSHCTHPLDTHGCRQKGAQHCLQLGAGSCRQPHGALQAAATAWLQEGAKAKLS